MTLSNLSVLNVQEWAQQRGPELLRLIKERNLTVHESRELTAVKAICPCHWTDEPKKFSTNWEDCDICGRRM